MTNRKADTIKVGGGADYAKVAERTKLFWQSNPHGSIDSNYKFLENGNLVYETTIVRNAKNPEEGRANGHAMGKVEKDKDFEKYETISVGRALGKLGYLASGEIASLEEMEDYYKEKEEKRQAYIQDQVDLFSSASTLDELKELWAQTNKAEPDILAAKDKRKVELESEVAK